MVLAPRVNCNTLQTYAHIWREVFDQIKLVEQRRVPGFAEETEEIHTPLVSLSESPENITPGVVCAGLDQLAAMQHGRPVLVILDEFDRVPNGNLKRAIADTIKTLSDRATPITLVIVGVADTVGDLILEHQSIERAVTQVPLPRMETSELNEILENGTERLGMRIGLKAKERIANLSQGLPSYTHRLALQAARRALSNRRLSIHQEDVRHAVRDVVNDTSESLRETYRRAVASTRSGTLFEQVILACACAKTDPFGYFAPPDVREPMSEIMGRKYDMPTFARHLKQFCEASRGPVLRQDGIKRRYRYRFINPLMQPFVVMNGIVHGFLTENASIVNGVGSDKRSTQ